MRSVVAGLRRDAIRTRVICACLLASLLLSACYSSLPLTSPVPEPASRIVARLTEQGRVDMAPWIGRDAVEVEGIVAEIGVNGWELLLLRVEQERGKGALWNRERVVFPAGTLASVRKRRLHKTRTAVFVGVATTVVIVVGLAFGVSGFLSGNGNGDPGPIE